ncbi:MAG: ribose 5-phosphate isomerase B [Spirochaetes bacterium]|nr:ribose 5-phosphate isomerase B [Spirochaetota bacterium]
MSKKEKIIIGSDHGGFELKEVIVRHLEGWFYIDNVGCDSDKSCDYPVYGQKVAGKVANGEGQGILICGTGIGMSITANRNSKVRAALCLNEYMARMSRMHNNANILVLGARVIGTGLALDIVDVWLKTKFDGGRHQKRLELIDKAEHSKY